jgi:hypothetical protein
LCLRAWLRLLFKVFFTWKYIKIIFFLFLKNYFWYQRIKMIWKHKKKTNLKQRKKIKKIQIFSKTLLKRKNKQGFRIFYKTRLKKLVKTTLQTQICNQPRNIKYNLMCCQITSCVCFTVNAKTSIIIIIIITQPNLSCFEF